MLCYGAKPQSSNLNVISSNVTDSQTYNFVFLIPFKYFSQSKTSLNGGLYGHLFNCAKKNSEPSNHIVSSFAATGKCQPILTIRARSEELDERKRKKEKRKPDKKTNNEISLRGNKKIKSFSKYCTALLQMWNRAKKGSSIKRE